MFANESIFKNVMDNLTEGVRFVDSHGRVSFWNRGAELITGYAPAEMGGTVCDIIHAATLDENPSVCRTSCPLRKGSTPPDHQHHEVFIQHKDGYLVPVLMNIYPLHDEDGTVVGAAETFHDISWKVKAIERIEELSKLSLIDPVTGAGTRRYAEMALRGRAEELARYSTKFGVAFVDVDGLGQINTLHDRETGDEVMRAIVAAISGSMRTFDTISRWEDDQLIIVAANIVNNNNLINMSYRLRQLVEKISIEGSEGTVRPTISIGASLALPGEEIPRLLDRVANLLEQSKSFGKNRVTVGEYTAGHKVDEQPEPSELRRKP